MTSVYMASDLGLPTPTRLQLRQMLYSLCSAMIDREYIPVLVNVSYCDGKTRRGVRAAGACRRLSAANRADAV